MSWKAIFFKVLLLLLLLSLVLLLLLLLLLLCAGGLAVVAVLLDIGPSPPNPALQFALSLAPEASHEQQTADQQPMQLESLLPQQKPDGHRPYIHYVGSLTTPPCSEDVQWFVFGDTVTIPYSQVVQFQEYAGKANPGLRANARPLQPINNRTVDYADFL